MLLPREVQEDPIKTFADWLQKAETAQIFLPNAMALATSTKKGEPSVRMVLLKGFDKKGFKFFTNYDSRKGAELSKNSNAALCFHWAPIQRQVRIEGKVEKLPTKDSIEYHASRPRGSQVAAVVSNQSQTIESYDQLLQYYSKLEAELGSKPVKRPPHWGGFRVVPKRIEFWLGRSNRLHERCLFERKKNGKWQITLLAP